MEAKDITRDGLQMTFDSQVVTPSPVDGVALFEGIKFFYSRFVRTSEANLLLCTFWTIHTHEFPHYQGSTGYPLVTSPLPECGKSVTLELLGLFVRAALCVGGCTAAALLRIVDQTQSTILLDEGDINFSADKEVAGVISGIFNNGYTPNKHYIKCVGEKHDQVKRFNCYSPKAVAGNGSFLQPATISRSFPIRLQRQTPPEDFFVDTAGEEAAPLRQQLELWAAQRIGHWLLNRRPASVPPWLKNRRRAISFPLFAIAEDLGGEYPARLSAALEEIFFGTTGKIRLDYKTQLLSDIRNVLTPDREAIATGELLICLHNIETSPWNEFSNGKPLTPHRLAKLLGDFDIEPGQLWLSGVNVKGYIREKFVPVWDQYLPSTPAHSRTPGNEGLEPLEPASLLDKTHFSKGLEAPPSSPFKNAVSSSIHAGSSPSSPLKPGERVQAGVNGHKKAVIRPIREHLCSKHDHHRDWTKVDGTWICLRRI